MASARGGRGAAREPRLGRPPEVVAGEGEVGRREEDVGRPPEVLPAEDQDGRLDKSKN